MGERAENTMFGRDFLPGHPPRLAGIGWSIARVDPPLHRHHHVATGNEAIGSPIPQRVANACLDAIHAEHEDGPWAALEKDARLPATARAWLALLDDDVRESAIWAAAFYRS